MSKRTRRLTAIAAVTLLVVVSCVVAMTRSSETLASYVDKVVSSSVFDVSSFGIEGSVTPGGSSGYGDHTTAASAASLVGSTNPGTVAFTTPIVVAPGQTAYAPLYLRTTSGSVAATTVSMSAATQRSGYTSDSALWGTSSTAGGITYGARVVDLSVASTCSATVFSSSQGTQLIAPGSRMSTSAPATTFALPASQASPKMVCFAFTLASNAATAYSSSNGKSIYPVWTFTGQSA